MFTKLKDKIQVVSILSIQPEISREPYETDPNLQVVKFATSPLMSTYLVAVVVGEYDFVEDTSADGIKVSHVSEN